MAGLSSPAPGLTQAVLDEHLPARLACQKLLTLVNAVGGRWDLVRRQVMDKGSFKEERGRDDLDWDVAWGECSRARRDLEDGLPRQVLDREVQLAKDLWRALNKVAESYLDEAPVAKVNELIKSYAFELEAWTEELPAHQAFWNGAYLTERPSASCLRDLEQASQEAAITLWTWCSKGQSEQSEQTHSELKATLAGIDNARSSCIAQDGAERIAIQFYGDLLVLYRRAIDAHRNGDDDGVRRAMLEEQEWISLLAGCQLQHKNGGPLAPVCTPRVVPAKEPQTSRGP